MILSLFVKDDYETILTRANKEIFNTYLSLQTLFQERQELNARILKEERAKGILEAKRIATSTLSHYLNNAAMEISGHSGISGRQSGFAYFKFSKTAVLLQIPYFLWVFYASTLNLALWILNK